MVSRIQGSGEVPNVLIFRFKLQGRESSRRLHLVVALGLGVSGL